MRARDRVRLASMVDCIDEAARTRPNVLIHCDRPLDIAPEDGLALPYSRVGELSRNLAAAMDAEGIAEGDVVAIFKSNHIDIYILASAVMRLGATPALLSPKLDQNTARALFETLSRPWIVCDHETATGPLRGMELEQVSKGALCVGGTVAGMPALLPRSGDAPDRTIREADAPVLITHTSGTTGIPKLAVQSNRTISENLVATTAWFRRLRVKETIGFYLSYAHIRVVTGLTGALLMGWPLAALTDPSPANADDFFSEHRPGVLETFPNTFILWGHLAASSSRPFRNVRWFMNTFDAMHPRARDEMIAASSRRGATYIQVYGQTETGPVTVRVYPPGLAKHAHPRCVGYPIPGFSRLKVASRGKGVPGDVLAQSKSLVLGYVGRDEEYASKRVGAWWRMTDLGERSRLGCLHLLDREVDETESVDSLLALEDRLLQEVPALREAVLIPMQGQPPVPLVCTHDDSDFDERAWAAATAEFPPLQPPLHCKWDEVPQTGTWKVRRLEARRLLERGDFTPGAPPPGRHD